MPSSFLVPHRGKKTAKKLKKMKKDVRHYEMKEYIKKMEIQKLVQNAALKAAKKGEPFDPEMLNPARKRDAPSTSMEEQERRFLLVKEWSRYQMQREIQRRTLLRRMLQSREKALQELRKVSTALYTKSLMVNSDLFPLDIRGPTTTPPIPTYVPPDPEN